MAAAVGKSRCFLRHDLGVLRVVFFRVRPATSTRPPRTLPLNMLNTYVYIFVSLPSLVCDPPRALQEDRELIAKLRPLARFSTPQDHDELIDNLVLARKMRRVYLRDVRVLFSHSVRRARLLVSHSACLCERVCVCVSGSKVLGEMYFCTNRHLSKTTITEAVVLFAPSRPRERPSVDPACFLGRTTGRQQALLAATSTLFRLSTPSLSLSKRNGSVSMN